MDPATLAMLGQVMAQMGGAIGKAGNTPLGDAAGGIGDVMGGIGKSQAQTNLMNKMAPSTTPAAAPAAQPSGMQTPVAGAAPMTADKFTAILADPKNPISKGSYDPATGKFTMGYDPKQLAEAAGGSQKQSPFLEALLQYR